MALISTCYCLQEYYTPVMLYTWDIHANTDTQKLTCIQIIAKIKKAVWCIFTDFFPLLLLHIGKTSSVSLDFSSRSINVHVLWLGSLPFQSFPLSLAKREENASFVMRCLVLLWCVFSQTWRDLVMHPFFSSSSSSNLRPYSSILFKLGFYLLNFYIHYEQTNLSKLKGVNIKSLQVLVFNLQRTHRNRQM